MFASKKRYVIYGSTRSSAPLFLAGRTTPSTKTGKKSDNQYSVGGKPARKITSAAITSFSDPKTATEIARESSIDHHWSVGDVSSTRAKSNDGGDYEFQSDGGNSNNERVVDLSSPVDADRMHSWGANRCGTAIEYFVAGSFRSYLYLHSNGSFLFHEGCEISPLRGVPG